MKIHFLGTGAAEGVPAMFCSCEYCKKIRSLGLKEYRSRTQVLIDGLISVDFPPEAFSNSLKFGVNLSKLKYLFVTHSHMDHFYAHDFILRGYKYAELEEDVLAIFGDSEVHEVFKECTAREIKDEVKKHLSFTEIKPYTEFYANDYRVIAIPANHKTKEDSLLYYIEKDGKGYLHLHDSNRICDEALQYLAKNNAKANAVAFDCTFIDREYKETYRHMSIGDNMVMKEKMLSSGVIDKDTKVIITHFSHNSNPTRERLSKIEKEYGVIAAYDGMEIEI